MSSARKPSSLLDTRVIYCGDNLDQLAKLPDRCVDLIYIDPPFNSNRNYEVFWGETKEKRSFDDRHASTQAYIEFMRPRCEQLARVLKGTGSFYYHCDWHASHYVKVMLDQLFGEMNFQNEIVWKRTSSHSDARRRFGDQTDAIFFYGIGRDYTFNRQHVEYSEAYIKSHYSNVDPDGRRFTTRDLRSPSPRPNLTYDYKGYKPHPNGWSISRELMAQWDQEGKLYFPQSKDGRIRVKRYLDEMPGTLVGNVWDDIEPVNSQAAERLGYPTQKPLALLDRIIRASSNENDIVLDAFCGCGTALVAAQNLGRQWIGIDQSPTACASWRSASAKTANFPKTRSSGKSGADSSSAISRGPSRSSAKFHRSNSRTGLSSLSAGSQTKPRSETWASTDASIRSRRSRRKAAKRPASSTSWTSGIPCR
ncbi:MAG: site-specific DNA-methyltransferase [Terriglobales bacterium]